MILIDNGWLLTERMVIAMNNDERNLFSENSRP